MQDQPYTDQPEPAQPRAGQRRRSTFAAIREIVQTLLLAAILFVGVRALVLPYEVDGSSMLPNLEDQERVLVNRQAFREFDLNTALNWIPGVDWEGSWNFTPFGQLERGDVVVLNPPVETPQPFIKRVIGLPGDEIAFEDGYVLVNGERLDEQYIPEPITECDPRNARVDAPTCDLTVPDDTVFVLGDNRSEFGSQDSRMYGVVAIDEIVGEAFFVNWPLDQIGPIGHGDYGE